MFTEQLPVRRIFEEWPTDGETMEFRLMLTGRLPSNRRAGVDAKHRIRRELHPQLKMLWQQHPTLRGSFDPDKNVLKKGTPRVEQLADEYARCGFRFVPLVKKKDFACALDILLLQRQGPFPVFSPIGDLDNRIKTLIDGLRVPEQCSEVGGQSPAPDENPFFVLMDDDKTIFQLQVSTEKLWVPPEPSEPENDIVAIIGVRVTTRGGNPIAYLCGDF